jgi:hypothetical protein
VTGTFRVPFTHIGHSLWKAALSLEPVSWRFLAVDKLFLTEVGSYDQDNNPSSNQINRVLTLSEKE